MVSEWGTKSVKVELGDVHEVHTSETSLHKVRAANKIQVYFSITAEMQPDAEAIYVLLCDLGFNCYIILKFCLLFVFYCVLQCRATLSDFEKRYIEKM